jgi:hypothetical protein
MPVVAVEQVQVLVKVVFLLGGNGGAGERRNQ